jgi:hypothetical protein
MEVFPLQIDNFSACGSEKAPTATELRKILSTPEAEVKAAFAAIVGEPFGLERLGRGEIRPSFHANTARRAASFNGIWVQGSCEIKALDSC